MRRGVYAEGPEDPTAFERELAAVLSSQGVAAGGLAGVLHGLDGVALDGRPTRRRPAVPGTVVVDGVPCTDGLQTLIDLAVSLDDLQWEQALESALHRRLLVVADLERALPELARARTAGIARIRRVLALRPPGATPTESLLETLMVQLARRVPGLPPAVRQLAIGPYRLDQSWPEIGFFLELDGQQHLGQPVYDARRETAIVAATGWLCGRFTWHEVVRVPVSTARRLGAVADQARRRPFAS